MKEFEKKTPSREPSPSEGMKGLSKFLPMSDSNYRRRLTEYDVTPYRPIVASSSASAPNTVDRMAVSRSWEVADCTSSDIGRNENDACGFARLRAIDRPTSNRRFPARRPPLATSR